jgi:signal transduction histidine kinase
MKIVNDLNLKKQASDLGVSIWQTPSFLFVLMGFINVIAMTATYFIAKNYDNPEVLVISECVVTGTIFFFGGMIVKGVEQITRLNKAKSEFIALASHQLRTPLAAVNWEVEILNSKFKKGLDKRQLKGIENIGVLTKRMTRLVSDLLDVAKIDQKKLLLKREKIDLLKIVNEVGNSLESLLKNNGKEARLIDAIAEGISEESCLKKIIAYAPDLVLIEISTPSFYNDLRISALIHQALPKAAIALCGAHATTFAQEILAEYDYIDYVLRGEYEYTLLELIKKIEANQDLNR